MSAPDGVRGEGVTSSKVARNRASALLVTDAITINHLCDSPERDWWLAAALAALADRALTFAYFIPTMIGLMNASDSPAAVAAAERWMRLNYLRHALVLIGHRSAPPSATAFLTILARPARPSGARTVALEPNGTSFAPSVMEVL